MQVLEPFHDSDKDLSQISLRLFRLVRGSHCRFSPLSICKGGQERAHFLLDLLRV
jgi:hypothetical protein